MEGSVCAEKEESEVTALAEHVQRLGGFGLSGREENMSVDNYYWVPTRRAGSTEYVKYKNGTEMISAHGDSPHRVFLAHGDGLAIDELYLFEDAADAQWFWDEGYKDCFFVDERGPETGPKTYGYDHMVMWLDGVEVASRKWLGGVEVGPLDEPQAMLPIAAYGFIRVSSVVN